MTARPNESPRSQFFDPSMKGERDQIIANDGSGKVWPDGWFVYSDGQIIGPLRVQEAFGYIKVGKDRKATLISRKGFLEWYMLQDVVNAAGGPESNHPHANLMTSKKYHLPETASYQSSHASVNSQKNTSVNTSINSAINTSVNTSVNTAPIKAHSILRKVKKPIRHPSLVPSLIKPVDPGAKGSPSHEPRSPSFSNSDSRAEISSLKGKQGKFLPKEQGPSTGEVIQEYFISKKKLRLGQLRNPWVYGLPGFFLSVGILWPIWLAKLSEEVSLHCEGAKQKYKAINSLALIPGVHILFVYRLAKQIISMESQNRYRSVSLPLAMFLSFFPPFVVVYLQNAVNKHWLLHIKSLLIKR